MTEDNTVLHVDVNTGEILNGAVVDAQNVKSAEYFDHEIAALFPMMGDDEYEEFLDDIRGRGLEQKEIMLYEGKILDGRHRYRACMTIGIEPSFVQYAGDDPIAYVLSLNLHTRQLSSGQQAMVVLDAVAMYAALAPRGGRPQKHGADLPHVSERAPRSRDKAAKGARTSGRAVGQAKRVRTAAPDLAERVKAGDLALDRADRIIRDREAEAKRVTKAREDAENQPVKPRCDIRHGDFREVLADLTDVDAIITDPPYPREFLPLLSDLAAWADKVLKPDGILAVLFGQTYLPEVYRRLDGHRPYRWTISYQTPGAGYASHSARVQSNWKPVLVYGCGPRFSDIIISKGTDAGAKDLHYWGQDYGAFHTLIERLTRVGETVADPFTGSGTTLLAANALGRHAIGAELDAEHVATARQRVA